MRRIGCIADMRTKGKACCFILVAKKITNIVEYESQRHLCLLQHSGFFSTALAARDQNDWAIIGQPLKP